MEFNLILGAGKSGLSIAKLLLENQEAVLIADDKLKVLPEELASYPLCVLYQKGLNMDLADVVYRRVIKSPGLSNTHPLVEKLHEKYFMYSDIEIAYQYADNLKFIGITGSNGKTTVTTLLEYLGNGEILAAGNIGTPLGDVVLKEKNKTIALELSSFQLEGIQEFKPSLATILNLSPDHLDRYLSVNEYYEAKLNILKNMDDQDIFLLNAEDVQLLKRVHVQNSIAYSLAQSTPIHWDGQKVWFNDIMLFESKTLKLVGLHNLSNAMVAASLAYLSGISLEQIQTRLASFSGVEHRLEYVREVNGVKFYNDSKATNPEATEVALQSFGGHIHLLCGGYDKHIPFDLLKKYKDKLVGVYPYGQTKDKLAEVFSVDKVYDDLDSALMDAVIVSQPGDIVLLSPACASYDQYDNYEQRGQMFKDSVGKLQ